MDGRCFFGNLPFALGDARCNENHELPGADEELPIRKEVSPEQHGSNTAEWRYAQLLGIAGEATQATPNSFGQSKRESISPLDLNAVRDVGHESVRASAGQSHRSGTMNPNSIPYDE